MPHAAQQRRALLLPHREDGTSDADDDLSEGEGLLLRLERTPDILSELVLDRKDGSFSADRVILRMINEAVYCLEERVSSATDIDMAMVAGAGFPLDRGGLLHHADRKGIDTILAGLKNLESKLALMQKRNSKLLNMMI